MYTAPPEWSMDSRVGQRNRKTTEEHVEIMKNAKTIGSSSEWTPSKQDQF